MHGLIFETSVCYWQNQPGCYLSERDMLALYVEMRFENKLRSDVMRYQIWSSNRNSIRMQIHARHNLVRRKGFLCQVSPRFPIVFNAWLVQMHFSMSKLNLIVSDESPSKVQTSAASEWKNDHLGVEYVPAKRTIVISSSNQSSSLSRITEWIFTDRVSQICYDCTQLLVLSKQSFAIDHKFY